MQEDIFSKIIWQIGPLQITDTSLTIWAMILVIFLLIYFLSRHLSLRPNTWQTIAEGVVSAVEFSVREVLPQHYKHVVPFIMSLWIFLGVANLMGLIPGLHSPTRDLSVTTALAIIVFLSVHWFGIRTQGLKSYLRHYLTPSPLLLPFHIISEISRTIALAVRLFGNMLSLEMVALILLLVAGFLVPVPILMLHIIEALVQAYIFGMLALIYIASAIQTQELRKQE